MTEKEDSEIKMVVLIKDLEKIRGVANKIEIEDFNCFNSLNQKINSLPVS
jgi:hypothetical protein